MKTSLCHQREQGLTLVELLVIIAVLSFLFMMLMPRMGANPKTRATRIQCVSNLKQIGLATRVWEGDHGDKFPWNIPGTNGGTMEFTTGTNLFRHFQVMSNELSTPKVLICPTDTARVSATNFSLFSDSNLSFFIGLDASQTDPQGILSGDRNITNGTPVRNGILELTTNRPSGWTDEMHRQVGNLTLSDDSVQQVSGTGLRNTVENTGLFTNRLQMPMLNP